MAGWWVTASQGRQRCHGTNHHMDPEVGPTEMDSAKSCTLACLLIWLDEEALVRSCLSCFGKIATLGQILAKMGRVSEVEKAQTSEKPPGRGKVSLPGHRRALVREFRAKSHVKPRLSTKREDESRGKVVVKNGLPRGQGGIDLMVSGEPDGACRERPQAPAAAVAHHLWALLRRLCCSSDHLDLSGLLQITSHSPSQSVNG